MTLWAQVAPHRPQGNKQHFLKPAPVPLLPAKASPLDGKLVRVEKPAVIDAEGKETSPAQNRALNQRAVPAGCQIIAIDKDGCCLYRSIAQGLTWLSGKKKTEHCHRDLRARANAHLRRRQAQYVNEWDGFGPALKKLEAESPTKAEGFTKYLDLAEKESAYGSVLELKALSRIYDVCLMVIPRDANFGTVVFKEAKAQKHRAIVLWYTPKHIDLVMPAEPTEHFPETLFARSAGQVIDLRAGGRSCHPSEDEGSVWTRASNAPSTQAPEVPECPEIRRRKDNKPDRFRLAQGPDMKYRLAFKCELCPYRTTRANLKILTSIKAHHMNKCHGGEGQLPKLASHKWFASRGKAEDFHWRCPLCRTGVSKVRNEISPKRLYQLKRQHKDQHHPEVSRSEWLTLMRAPNAGSAARKKRALCLGKSNVEAARLKLPPHIIPFTMPTAVRSRKGPCPIVERTIVKLIFASYYKCRRCGNICHRGPKTVEPHLGESCPSICASWVMQRSLRSLDAMSEWAKTHKVSGMPRSQVQEIFASARQAVKELPRKVPLPFDVQPGPQRHRHCGCRAGHALSIAAFQEADINPLSVAGFVAAWRRHKFQVVACTVLPWLLVCPSGLFNFLTLVAPIVLQLGWPPPALAPLVEAIYSRQLRLFVVDSYTSDRWHRSHHGLLQGCPLSPFLSLTVGFLWSQHVAKPGVEAGIFVDDRILWLTGPNQSAAAVQAALLRSDYIDAAAGLTCSRRKCHLVTNQPACPWRVEAGARGYEISPNLQFLGVELCLDSGQAVPLRLNLHKLHVRLRHTANPAFPFEVRLDP
eukprot:s1259_g16.t2